MESEGETGKRSVLRVHLTDTVQPVYVYFTAEANQNAM